MGRTRNAVCLKKYLGFESLSLRHEPCGTWLRLRHAEASAKAGFTDAMAWLRRDTVRLRTFGVTLFARNFAKVTFAVLQL